jgi:hypothetical protein
MQKKPGAARQGGADAEEEALAETLAVHVAEVVPVSVSKAEALGVAEAELLSLDAPIPLIVIFPKLMLAVPVDSEKESYIRAHITA